MEMGTLSMGQGVPWATLFTRLTPTGPEESTWTQRKSGLSDSQVRDKASSTCIYRHASTKPHMHTHMHIMYIPHLVHMHTHIFMFK